MIPASNITYCINSLFCGNPINPGHDVLCCSDCGANLLVGGKYRLVEILNRENSDPNKVVYRAINTENQSNHVLKIVDNPKPELGKYLKREYEFLRGNVAPFPNIKNEDFFEWTPDPTQEFFFVYVLALPFIEGKDSEEWIQQNGPISESECVNWIFQVLDYLEIFSELTTMHRDIKPSNIIVTPEDTIKLIDFGSVRQIDEEYISILEGIANNDDGSDIQRGTRIFTFGYSPPEQLRGQAVLQSDFFALGKTAIYWVSGKSPADKIGEDEPWHHSCPNVSQAFITFIDCLTAMKAGSRPLNASVIRLYLETQYLKQLEAEEQTKNPQTNRKYAFWGLASLFVLSLIWLGIGQFFYQQGQRSLDDKSYQRAKSELNIALLLQPWSREIRKKIGSACIGIENLDCAQKNYKVVLDKDPQDVDALYHLGIILEMKNDFEEATEFYINALKQRDDHVEALIRLARIAIKKEDFEVAHNYIEKGLEINSNSLDKSLFEYFRGYAFYKQGRYQVAESALLRSVEIEVNPSQSELRELQPIGDALCVLAEVQPKLRRPESAIAGVRSGCLRLQPQYPEGMLLREALFERVLKILQE